MRCVILLRAGGGGPILTRKCARLVRRATLATGRLSTASQFTSSACFTSNLRARFLRSGYCSCLVPVPVVALFGMDSSHMLLLNIGSSESGLTEKATKGLLLRICPSVVRSCIELTRPVSYECDDASQDARSEKMSDHSSHTTSRS
jgi:hypothetical protein